MSFDKIIAAMAVKHGIDPAWGGCRPGIILHNGQRTCRHEFEFLEGGSVAKFSKAQVEEAVAGYEYGDPVPDWALVRKLRHSSDQNAADEYLAKFHEDTHALRARRAAAAHADEHSTTFTSGEPLHLTTTPVPHPAGTDTLHQAEAHPALAPTQPDLPGRVIDQHSDPLRAHTSIPPVPPVDPKKVVKK